MYEHEEGTPLRWEPSPRGQHLELGISEMNLFLLLGQLGLAYELQDVQLLPVGTVYDPFVCRGLDALIYGTYSGARFVVAGTPSGVSLSREGGAHQSAITASIGSELPGLAYWEPCYALETEWVLLEVDPAHGRPRARARRRTCGSRRRRSSRRRSWSGWRRWAATRRARPCCPAPTGWPGRRPGSTAGAW